MSKKIVTLAGDGIGPEIMSAGLSVLKAVSKKIAFEYELEAKDFGGIAIDKHGHPLPEETLQAVKNADAILLAAIGHPKYNNAKVRPEQGLLALRKELGLYANVRPLKIYPALKRLSPIRNVENVDFLVIRELTGGIYFGQHELADDKARDVNDYSADEIRRILHFAFKSAQSRPRKLLTSVDKQNVLATSKLWRKIADEIADEYPDVRLEHQLVDSCAMLLITNPQQFDVIVTENLFGDILSDEASSLAGSLGVMPSSSHGFKGLALYEPIHGSAPDIAGKGIANPVSMILSIAMMLRESFGQEDGAAMIEKAVTQTFTDGILTKDLGGTATTKEMTEAILKNCQ
ncbi:3-isopropylmalate dehydrogenase [Lactococcus lactis subsp. lactis]|uniref:3-isopropylmalate dehydrogenase n=2 Tax=Lactococcus lactis TaxID=1358 RepID=A0A2A5SCZ1_LACLH|nr:3-isopropylmalate dehydrogenase [Lactococcus lactis]KAA8704005.1 3-isopropylmalate dehydrogenase [Lactococcus lactis subsp. hordniae]KSU12763.1 3-isopropylmalate dehydrogenase [Lactococcus lactis subsp. lactis]MCT3135336.1 3-isopropylmalate dehydrogenase [Lactococcus lactis]PCS11301.1 3-isopropylmalate dehydrogenase [Lactococcus lactis subsp. hordniae]